MTMTPDEETVFHVFFEEILFTAEYPDGYGEIETRSLLPYIRRSEIDCDTCGGK